jgi:hypothetical protein
MAVRAEVGPIVDMYTVAPASGSPPELITRPEIAPTGRAAVELPVSAGGCCALDVVPDNNNRAMPAQPVTRRRGIVLIFIAGHLLLV